MAKVEQAGLDRLGDRFQPVEPHRIGPICPPGPETGGGAVGHRLCRSPGHGRSIPGPDRLVSRPRLLCGGWSPAQLAAGRGRRGQAGVSGGVPEPRHVTDHIKNGRHVPGIFELNPNMSIRETVEELLLIWGASEMKEYQDVIIYLPIAS